MLEGEPVDLKPAVRRQITRIVQKELRGPLPSPETLAGYDAVQAGLAERIVAMAEKEQEHRHTMDRDALGLDRQDLSQRFTISKRGQMFALIALGIMASLAIVLAVMGEPGWATVAGGVDVAAVVGVFVTGQLQGRESSDNALPSEDEPKALPEAKDANGAES